MNSDFELLNCVADRGTFGATLLIDSCWSRDFFLGSLISVAKLFTIACTRELMFLLSASIILWFILTKILCTHVYHMIQLNFYIFNCGNGCNTRHYYQ